MHSQQAKTCSFPLTLQTPDARQEMHHELTCERRACVYVVFHVCFLIFCQNVLLDSVVFSHNRRDTQVMYSTVCLRGVLYTTRHFIETDASYKINTKSPGEQRLDYLKIIFI